MSTDEMVKKLVLEDVFEPTLLKAIFDYLNYPETNIYSVLFSPI